MGTETIHQAYTFGVFIVNGILLGILFDFFRILRKSFKTTDFLTYIEDILFWILAGILLLYFIFVFNNGTLRLYLFLGIMIGTFSYMLFFSKHIIHYSLTLVRKIKRMFLKIISFFYYPIRCFYQMTRKIILRPVSFIVIHLRNFTSKNIYSCFKRVKNILFYRKKEGKQA